TPARLADTLHEDLAPRACSLVGPCGAGKSSCSVFMSQLLSSPTEAASEAALNVLAKTDAKLAKQFRKHPVDTSGFIRVLLTGTPEPLGRRLVTALYEAVNEYWTATKRKRLSILDDLQALAAEKSPSTSSVIGAVKKL